MSFTNASPLMSATRGKMPFFGTNPLSLAAPNKDRNDPFVLDMATSVVALGKLEIAARRGESIPHGWAVDRDGHSTDDPTNFHTLLPLGGLESSSGYKGYGLAMMGEIFCSVLGGATMAPDVRKWTDNAAEANLGQCFIAINPDCFAPGFEDRMAKLTGDLRSQESVQPDKPVLVHGDPERMHMQKCDQQGGIEYHPNQLAMAVRKFIIYSIKIISGFDRQDKLAEQFNVEPLERLDKK